MTVKLQTLACTKVGNARYVHFITPCYVLEELIKIGDKVEMVELTQTRCKVKVNDMLVMLPRHECDQLVLCEKKEGCYECNFTWE